MDERRESSKRRHWQRQASFLVQMQDSMSRTVSGISVLPVRGSSDRREWERACSMSCALLGVTVHSSQESSLSLN